MTWGVFARLVVCSALFVPVLRAQAFEAYLDSKVLPHFRTGVSGSLTGKGGMPLFYRVFVKQGSDKAITLIPGYTENSLKYAELIYDFSRAGYTVYLMDHRGMGQSGREVVNRQIVYVENFEDYVDDLEKFFEKVVLKRRESHQFVFAHSMGGLVAAKLLARHPNLVDAAVFSAPLFELNTGGYSSDFAGSLAFALDWTGGGKQYAPGFQDFNPYTAKWDFKASAGSKDRYDAYLKQLQVHSRLVMGGPSAHWVREILRETEGEKIRLLGRKVSVPVLLFQSGLDRLVKPGGHKVFCDASPKCLIARAPQARHEIYRDVDLIRNSFLSRTLEFFKAAF